MSAYACEPGKGSEPGAGWAWTRAAAFNHDVWVMTRENNRNAIEEALLLEPNLRLTPVYLDLPNWARWWKRGGFALRIYYVLWQGLARRRAKQLHREIRFDVAHHITFAVDWLPAGVVGIKDLPSVWGPVGGTAPFPWTLRKWLGWRGLAGETTRLVTGGIGRRLFGDWAAKRASIMVAQNHEVAHRFAFSAPRIEPHAAPPRTPGHPEPHRRPDSGVRTAVFVGRLVAWKGIRLAIATLAEPGMENWKLEVYGAGPELPAARRLAERLGASHRIRFLGLRPRNEVLGAYAKSDAMLFPTMHDSAPWAVAEAILAGTTVVCLDRCGPRVMIERTGAGIAVPCVENASALLAQALATSSSSVTSDRADSALCDDRLPPLLTKWFGDATARDADPHARTRRA
jgi:glycosyltransferase involved in cell wall biosynthesis